MARSIKSKKGMFLRRIKRIRYGKKELIRLNNMLGIPNKEDKPDEDVEMKTEEDRPKNGLSSRDYKLLKRVVQESDHDTDDSDVDKQFDEVMALTSSKFLRRKCYAKELSSNKRQLYMSKAKGEAKTEEQTGEAVDESTKMAGDVPSRKRDSKTLVDDFGSYPNWMSQKKIKAMAKVTRVMNKKKKKLGKLTARKAKPGKGKKSHSDSDEDNDNEEAEDFASEVSSIEDNLEMETNEAHKTTTDKTASTKVASAAVKGKKTNTIPTAQKNNDDTAKSVNDDEAIETIDLSD